MEGKRIKNKKLLLVVLAIVLVISTLGLVAVELMPKSKVTSASGIELDCFVNQSDSDEYDSSLFYRNDLYIFGGDPDVIWVSEEQGGEEYGGYFYMYTSGNDGVDLDDYGTYKTVVTCLRSKDLNDWELCGQNGGEDGIINGSEGDVLTAGFCVWIDDKEWVVSHVWAPEVVYNEDDGKYYMYANAIGPYHTEDNDPNWEYNEEAEIPVMYDAFYGAIFMSDTPIGPFKLANSERYYGLDKNGNLQANGNGKIIYETTPHINVTSDLMLDEYFTILDYSPVYDANGDLYLYFARSKSTGHDHNCVWGVKMKDMITPDWSTLTMLTACNYQTVEKSADATAANWDESAYQLKGQFAEGDKLIAYTDAFTGEQVSAEDNLYKAEKIINEGPQVLVKDGRYYLCYSPIGYSNPYYDVMQAVSDSPLGPFKKIDKYPATVVGRNHTEDQMTGTGHQTFVEVDGEMFCIYFVHADPFEGSTSGKDGRIYAFDRVFFTEVPGYGTLLYGNGPTKNLQPLPSITTGFRNIASEATITATGADKDTIRYANDGLFVTHDYFKDWELSVDGPTTITLAFDEPKTIRSIMVYNSIDYSYAFSKIDNISFELAERPSWYLGSDYNSKAFISDIPFSTDYVNQQEKYMRAGGSAVVSFDEITVNSIKITISQKFDDKTSAIKLSDIVILGK